uniref:Uncharacterized protein n=1 Tax=Anguilla anguilla TaxID=7936 RepID=A0A0E9VWH0_ANGAN
MHGWNSFTNCSGNLLQLCHVRWTCLYTAVFRSHHRFPV